MGLGKVKYEVQNNFLQSRIPSPREKNITKQRIKNRCNNYDLEFDGTLIDIKEHLKILGVCLDNKLSFKEHTNVMLKRVYAKIAALRRLKHLVPIDTLLLLYRSFIIPHFEYCNSLLIGIGKTLNKKMEDANYYGLRTVMNTSLLKLLGMRTLEHRRIEQSLIIFFKCFKENGPRYITNLFKPWVTPYNLRSSGLNVEQRPYNSRFFHGSYSCIISRIWNQLPPAAKNAANVPAFHLNTINFGGCQCSSCFK